MITFNLNLILSIVCAVAELLSGAAFAVETSHLGFGSFQTCAPAKWAKGECFTPFFVSYVSLILCILSFFMLLVEVGLIIGFKYAMYFGGDYIRAGIYLLKAIACLGAGNDLGIGAGSIELIAGGGLMAIGILGIVKNRGTGSVTVSGGEVT